MECSIYQCPHCSAVLEVPVERLDGTLVCPRPQCQRPFHPEVPIARQLRAADGGETPEPDYRLAAAANGAAEQVIEELHPTLFRSYPFRFIACLLLVIAGFAGAAWKWLAFDLVYFAGSLGVALLGLILLGVWVLHAALTSLTITTRRTIFRRGLLARRSTELRHEEVREVHVHQSFLSRLFGVGDLTIRGPERKGPVIGIRGLPRPEEAARHVRGE
jgi:hypothetical protein